jgi:broad specificity phosphatase PhoE
MNESDKVITLARHGQSGFNQIGRYHLPSTPLSALGQLQARLLAARLSSMPEHQRPQVILSSTMKRALDTATSVAIALGVPLIQCALLTERLRPSAQLGRLYMDEGMPELSLRLQQEFALGGRVADEENFVDIWLRVEMAQTMVADRPEQRILVVSHGFFMRMIMARVLMGSHPDIQSVANFERGLELANTGLSTMTYVPASERPWKLICANDDSHLR